MSKFTFDPQRSLARDLASLTPAEAISLGIALCYRVEEESGSAYHGGIWPGNICFNGDVALIGPHESKGLKEMGPDALEYIAPEQFWKGELTPAGDVYSIGLVLYTALNGGLLPFFSEEGANTPEERASALQRRMRGAEMGYPRSACRELGEVILCATRFDASQRFSTPADFRAALEALPEDASIPAIAPVLRLKPKEIEAAHNYKVDKNFEKTTPQRQAKPPKRRTTVDENMDAKSFRKPPIKRKWALPFVAAIIIVIALILLLKGCDNSEPDDFEFVPEPPVTESEPPVAPEVTPDVEITPDPDEEEPTEEPAEPRFTIFVDDVTWEQAKANCEAMGGHLAVVDNQERLDAIIAMAEEKGASFVWLGSYRGADGLWYNVTGEPMSFSIWDAGEPSAIDADGTREDYLLLWYRAALGAWTYNDMRNDPISVIPATYSGKVAYICQFD
ncbi:MAG: hypothetical protein IKV79_04380 [Oscillospiraceae bacterium]|nr:hypothetical protein [Oscillospiraceae bacterium]